jgi:hypothetical protein
MKLTSFQIVLYLIFIICILLISYYYITSNTPNYNTPIHNTQIYNTNLKKSNQLNTKEGFTDDTGSNDALKKEINEELNKLNIKDVITQKKIFTYLTSLASLLNKYNYIDAPITMNNNGKMCENWGNYSNGEYNASLNSCLNIPGQNDRTCLNNNTLVSCSKYYNDGQIENLNNIDTNELVNNSKYNIYLGINDINTNVNKANIDMTIILTDYISKRNLENQQKYFIKYNEYNLSDKKKIIDKTNKEFEKTENDVNINKIQFQQSVEQNNQTEAKKNKYYNYIFYTVILIIIVSLLNFMFSNLE